MSIDLLLSQNNHHVSWRPILEKALGELPENYISYLAKNPDEYLPKSSMLFSAFLIPIDKVKYILVGESPYPRLESANGYAFWDNAICALWSNTGLSKQVNRATSMRNMLKMLLVANNSLTRTNTTQQSISQLDKSRFVQTNLEFFNNLISHGFLLLNASLIFENNRVPYHAKLWQPAIYNILQALYLRCAQSKLLLFGKIAERFNSLPYDKLIAEHPYNISFITNPDVIKFFAPLNLLQKSE